MDLIFAIRNRRAVRDFAPEAVSRAAIADAIGAATMAPSAMNLQPWLFAVVEGAERLRELSTRAKAHLLATLDPASPAARHRDHLTDPAMNLFHDAPALVIVCARDGVLGRLRAALSRPARQQGGAGTAAPWCRGRAPGAGPSAPPAARHVAARARDRLADMKRRVAAWTRSTSSSATWIPRPPSRRG
jgi:nitroreductase